MSDDEYRNGFGEDTPTTDTPAEEPVKTDEEIAAEEAKAEEEFISTPEDHVENPLVPDESDDDSEDEDRLKGAIGSGNLAVDYPEEKEEVAPESNEENTAVEETPVETPAEEPAAEPVVEAAAPVAEATATVADVAAQVNPEPKKKSKAGLIITLVIVFLLLIGGGVGFFIWLMINESPENMLKDSLAKIWTSENVQMSGSLSSDQSSGKFGIDFDGVKSGGNVTGSGKIKAKYNGMDINIEFSASYIKGGEAYFKLDGLKKLLKNFETDNDDDDDDISSLMGDYSTLLSSILGAVVKKVDGQWYKISASELGEDDPYGCILENLDGAMDKASMQKVADVYKEHPFITIKKDSDVKEEDGIKYIPVVVDKKASKEFAKAVKDIDSFKKISACYTSSESDDDGDEEESKTDITLGVKSWSHELVSAKVEGKKDDDKTKLDVKITYDKKDVSAPENAKDASKLGDDITKEIKKSLNSYIDDYCKSYAVYGQTYVDYCKQMMQTQMEKNFDITKLFGGFLGSSSSSEDSIDL